MNPVVFSLIFACLTIFLIPSIDFVFISWWGASFAGIYGTLILLPVVLYAGYAFRKFPTIIAFILTILLIASLTQNSYQQILSLLFFAGVMLIEIKTSPVKIGEQVIYGFGGAVLVLYMPSILSIDSHILALAAINLLYLVYREMNIYITKISK